MTGKVFLDTNILLYAEFDDGSDKHCISQKLLLQDIVGAEVFVSVQVFNEFYVQAIRKGKTVNEIETVLQWASYRWHAQSCKSLCRDGTSALTAGYREFRNLTTSHTDGTNFLIGTFIVVCVVSGQRPGGVGGYNLRLHENCRFQKGLAELPVWGILGWKGVFYGRSTNGNYPGESEGRG